MLKRCEFWQLQSYRAVLHTVEINKFTITFKKIREIDLQLNLLQNSTNFTEKFQLFFGVLLEVSSKMAFWSTNFDDSINSFVYPLKGKHSHLSFSRQTEYNEKGRRRLIVDAMNGDGLVTFYYILALICKTRISGVHEKNSVKPQKNL